MSKIGDTLKRLREENGLTGKEATEKLRELGIDISAKTLYGYESGRNSTNADMFLALCQIYKCQNIMEVFSDSVDDVLFTNKEWNVIEKYRALDDPGRSHVDTVLQWETDRMKQIEQTPAAIVELQNGSGEKGRLIDYYRSVSAGSGQVIFEDVYADRILMPDIPEYRKVAYAVKVNGKSMEPRYNDGDILLVEPTCEVEIGEIGIFNVDGKAYVKKLGKEKLISLNKGYDDIPLTEDSLCMGRVVGKL